MISNQISTSFSPAGRSRGEERSWLCHGPWAPPPHWAGNPTGFPARRWISSLSSFLRLFFAFPPEQPASAVVACSPLGHLPLLLSPWEMCPLFSLLPWGKGSSLPGVFVLGFISRIGFRETPNYFDPRREEVGALPRTCLPNACGLPQNIAGRQGRRCKGTENHAPRR